MFSQQYLLPTILTDSFVKFNAYMYQTSKLDADPHPNPSGDWIQIITDPDPNHRQKEHVAINKIP